MTKTQLFYIGTSKVKEIRQGGAITFDWGTYGAWTSFASPVAASTTNVKYNKTSKNAAGASAVEGLGGLTKLGTWIPATVTREVSGVERQCRVRYEVRGYTIYTRTKALTKKKKMAKTVYTTARPYQYRLQYEDKPVVESAYSSYQNGIDYIYFADHYYDEGEIVPTSGHMPHPTSIKIKYSDVRRNFESSANNSDGRDNEGSYVLSNVRSNVVTLSLTWHGLTPEQAADLLDTLNPSKDESGAYNYVTVQYFDPATATVQNKTFYASDRDITPYSNGIIDEVSVTLTEV